MGNPVLVKTKYTLDWDLGELIPDANNPAPPTHINECEIVSTRDCVLIMKEPHTFGVWKIKLKRNVPKTLKVAREGESTGWYALDMTSYKQQEPMEMSAVMKGAAMPQDPPVLPLH
jgi:hypothetical protein